MSTPQAVPPVPSSSPPPLPLDVATATAAAETKTTTPTTAVDPLACPPLRWGLLGCGRVTHDFCLALTHVPTASVVACATANDAGRAAAFAALHHIATAYGSYAALVADTAVDAVYVGNVHAFRREIGELCLRANKHVLLEKPFACATADAQFLIDLAAERRLFLQEGLWTRFFPAVEQARHLVVTEGLIGDIVNVTTDFHFSAAQSERYPESPVYQRRLGGGASLLIAPYPISAALLFFGGRQPETIQAVGQVDARTGVDLQAAVQLQFAATGSTPAASSDSNNSGGSDATASTAAPTLPGAGVASLCYGMLGESGEVTTVVGTKGRLTIESPCHCPTSLTVLLGTKATASSSSLLRYHYPLPPDTPRVAQAGGFFYPNSAGFCYEAAAVARCIAAGRPCCPQFTLDETLVAQRILEATRLQLNVKAIQEE